MVSGAEKVRVMDARCLSDFKSPGGQVIQQFLIYSIILGDEVE